MFGLFASQAQATQAGAAVRDPRWRIVVTRTATRRDAVLGLPVAFANAVPLADGRR